MPAETGFPRADVADDFLRARRRQVLSRLAHRLRGEPDDVNLVLPFDDVVAALGMRGERYAGLQTIELDSIVGTVDSRRDFDRHFRPTSSRVRERWERLALAQLAHRLRREPDDVNLILPFDDVVAALGLRGEHYLGLQTIKLDTVVGTVDSRRDFDRHFRPTSSRVRERWERLALAQKRGESIPPIDVYRIGDLHFVKDGHHRVSIAMATGQDTIDAYVTEVQTVMPATGIRHRGDLLVKDYERLFRSRVPLPEQAYATISFTDPWAYAELGEAVEAWGYRYIQHAHRFFDREEIARLWYAEEYLPVVRMLHSADLVGSGGLRSADRR